LAVDELQVFKGNLKANQTINYVVPAEAGQQFYIVLTYLPLVLKAQISRSQLEFYQAENETV
jgi:hypothetical protein